ncbi:MAG: CDP-diacylglycerol--glycerol-3-phosphate 3-phosphatidyltransferase [Deltaproteobacteria bacterium]|nr:CDP-diacylglycerol--glycerol-3-phosphate 3-phosphatidyltransferase [Deltaproteobacteria bacterium]
MDKSIIRNIPNYLTFLRVALIPIFVVLLCDPSKTMINAAAIVFIFAAITDYVDGFIARRWAAVSDFGKLLDPIADKILVISALIMLTSLRGDLYGEPWVPGPLVVLVVAREIWVTGLRAVAGSQGLIVAAGNLGKWKSFLQILAVVLLLYHDTPLEAGNWRLNCQVLGIIVLGFSLIFSYLSATIYTYEIFRACKLLDVQASGGPLSSSDWEGDNSKLTLEGDVTEIDKRIN